MVRAVVLVSVVVGAALLLIAWRGRAPLSLLRRSPRDTATGVGYAPPAPAPCEVVTPAAPAAPGAPVAAGAPGAASASSTPTNTGGIRPAPPPRRPKRNNRPSHFAGPVVNAARRTGSLS